MLAVMFLLKIQQAFASGAPYLRSPAGVPMVLLPEGQCGVNDLDAALNRLALAVPSLKRT